MASRAVSGCSESKVCQRCCVLSYLDFIADVVGVRSATKSDGSIGGGLLHEETAAAQATTVKHLIALER